MFQARAALEMLDITSNFPLTPALSPSAGERETLSPR